MIICKFTVKNQRLIHSNHMCVPTTSYGVLKCEFNFITKDWKDVEEIMVSFSYKGNNYVVPLDKNNQCYVPIEVIHTPSFGVVLFGGDIVTNKLTVTVEEYKTSGGSVLPPIIENVTNSSAVFVPSISEDKILSWTIADNSNNLEVPSPVDLNPFDEWTEDGDVKSEYEWEEDV